MQEKNNKKTPKNIYEISFLYKLVHFVAKTWQDFTLLLSE